MDKYYIIVLIIMLLVYIVLYIKHKKLNNQILLLFNELNTPLRKGYFKHTLTYKDNGVDIPFLLIIYLYEIERYTNGESKTKFIDFEFEKKPHDVSKNEVKSFINDHYTTLKKTDDITWLEKSSSLEEDRKNKLDRLKKLIKYKKNEK